MKHTLSTFEAENRCLDKLAQPELKKRGCLYKKCVHQKTLFKSNFVAYFVKVYKDLSFSTLRQQFELPRGDANCIHTNFKQYRM